MTTGEQQRVRSVERALEILECFDNPRQTHTVSELAERVGVPLPSAYRLVNTLVCYGYLDRPRPRDPLRLGVSVIRLGWIAQAGLDLRDAARPILEKLAFHTSETAVLMVPSETQAVCIDNIEGTSPIRPTSLRIGEHVHYNAGALPLTVLAHLEEAQRARVLAGPLPKLTKATLVTQEALAERCAQIRAEGYAYSRDEAIEGTAAVGAPIFGPGETLVGALGLTCIDEHLVGLETAVVEAAAEVSAAMGHRSSIPVSSA